MDSSANTNAIPNLDPHTNGDRFANTHSLSDVYPDTSADLYTQAEAYQHHSTYQYTASD